jgi:DNA-directed RNA polymerase specialized sigma24 family protein
MDPIHTNPDTNAVPSSVTAGVTEANDNGREGREEGGRAGSADTTRLVVTPEVVAAIKGTLARHGRKSRFEDDVPEVQTRALEAARRGPMPKDAGQWKALAATIAERYALDEKKKAKARQKYDTGLCEEPDSYGPIEHEGGRDPVDTKRYLTVLKELFDTGRMSEMGGEILWGVAEELSYDEIAEETGLTDGQVRTRLQRMRDTFYRRIADLGLLAVLVVVAPGFPHAQPANSRGEHARLEMEAG